MYNLIILIIIKINSIGKFIKKNCIGVGKFNFWNENKFL